MPPENKKTPTTGSTPVERGVVQKRPLAHKGKGKGFSSPIDPPSPKVK